MARTDDLINLLSKDTLTSASFTKDITRMLLCVIPLALLATYGVALWTEMPLRKDYLEAIFLPFVALKQLVPLLVIITLLPVLAKLYRPHADLGNLARFCLLAAGLVDVAIIIELYLQPSENWMTLFVGKTMTQCLTGVSFISASILCGGLYVMRGGATVRPTYTGFVLGIMSGGIGAFLYAFLCMEDSPLFYGVWYSLAVLNVGAVGAILGSRILRW